jgi:hypothetical protein
MQTDVKVDTNELQYGILRLYVVNLGLTVILNAMSEAGLS